MTTARYEICAWCLKRQPYAKLLPLAISSPDQEPIRQYKCRNEAACLVRVIRKKRLKKVMEL